MARLPQQPDQWPFGLLPQGLRPRTGFQLSAILDHYRKPRVLGLDILRIVASLTIILYHGNIVGAFGRNPLTQTIRADGYLAVDVFFVLSGWLLTRQVLRMRSAFTSSIAFAIRFWTRRWMRTIPPYWIVLLLVFLVGNRLEPLILKPQMTLPMLLGHAFFLQTIMPPNAYPVSWSLVAEEWFYLLLPFVILLALRVRSPRIIVGIGLAAILLPGVLRALLLSSSMPWDGGINVEPEARFDGLVIGACLAALSLVVPWWERVLRVRRVLLGQGLVVIGIVLAIGVGDSWGYRVFGLLAFNLGLGCLLPFMSQLRWPSIAPPAVMMATAYLAELTYPLYLLHPILELHWTHSAGLTRFLYAGLGLIVLFGAASLLHLAVERPILALRDRRDDRLSRPVPGGVREPAPAASWKEPARRRPEPGRRGAGPALEAAT